MFYAIFIFYMEIETVIDLQTWFCHLVFCLNGKGCVKRKIYFVKRALKKRKEKKRVKH